MREITQHKVNPANDQVNIFVRDEPGAGGACHVYDVELPSGGVTRISFQNGPIAEAGVNGVTHEVLLAIVRDRLMAFQAGLFACDENEKALHHVTYALEWLKTRTLRRMERGVEGTHTV